ncbi:hypothetical protein UPYG_G00288370 [Umbra pygmaea]|uniref:Synenkephalin n=1 Tax=Umbra pygmaea TaxID=75934 RepID=A0ABD0W4C6_UMBPY
MAVPGNSLWMLQLCAYFALTAGADCGKDCALCVYRLLGQHTTIPTLSCSVECEGHLDAAKIHLCRDLLLEQEHATIDIIKQDEVEGEENLAKRYGGFMKRYGGFMIQRSPTTEGGVLDWENSPIAEEEEIRLEILKILNAEAEGLRDGDRDVAKRYGGFMRRDGDSGALEGPSRPLKKRYGGFMRRVGRPEWLEAQKIQGGPQKRTWEEDESPLAEIEKRYGGFMD